MRGLNRFNGKLSDERCHVITTHNYQANGPRTYRSITYDPNHLETRAIIRIPPPYSRYIGY